LRCINELGDVLHDVILKIEKGALAGTDTPVTDYTDFSSESGNSDRSEKPWTRKTWRLQATTIKKEMGLKAHNGMTGCTHCAEVYPK
jgi:hypothetical protein